jgi:hypothetical protein
MRWLPPCTGRQPGGGLSGGRPQLRRLRTRAANNSLSVVTQPPSPAVSLRRLETEAAEVAERARAVITPSCPVRAILDDVKTVPGRDCPDRRHIGHAAVQVNDGDGTGT